MKGRRINYPEAPASRAPRTPVEKFSKERTGSIGIDVPPEVMNTTPWPMSDSKIRPDCIFEAEKSKFSILTSLKLVVYLKEEKKRQLSRRNE